LIRIDVLPDSPKFAQMT